MMEEQARPKRASQHRIVQRTSNAVEDHSWHQFEAHDAHPQYRRERALAEAEAARYREFQSVYDPSAIEVQARPINFGDFPVPERPLQIPLAGTNGEIVTTFELDNEEMVEREEAIEAGRLEIRALGRIALDGGRISPTPTGLSMRTIPNLTQPSQEEEEEEEEEAIDNSRHGDLEAGLEATGPFEKLYRDSGNNKAVLLAGAFGLKSEDGSRMLGDWTEEPYASLKQRNASIPKVKQHLRPELTRRLRGLDIPRKQKKCSSFSAVLCRKRMQQYPITDPRDIAFIRKEEGDYYKLISKNKQLREEAARERLLEADWRGNLPYLRLYCSICHPRARVALVNNSKVLERPELDAGGSSHDEAPETFEEAVAEVYNDANIVFHTERLPKLHSEYRDTIELKFEDMPGGAISTEEIKQRYAQARGMLIKLIFAWERSGNGFGQRPAVLPDGTANREFGRFDSRQQAGDNRSSFLNDLPVHLLYLWYLADTMDILSNVLNVLSKDVQVDCDNIRTDLSHSRRKNKRGGTSSSSAKKKMRDDAVLERVVQAQVDAGNAITSMAVDSKENIARQYRTQGDDYMIRAMLQEDTPVKVKLEKLSKDYYEKAKKVEAEIEVMKVRLNRNLMDSFAAATESPTESPAAAGSTGPPSTPSTPERLVDNN